MDSAESFGEVAMAHSVGGRLSGRCHALKWRPFLVNQASRER
jgi:hypothetical protein